MVHKSLFHKLESSPSSSAVTCSVFSSSSQGRHQLNSENTINVLFNNRERKQSPCSKSSKS